MARSALLFLFIVLMFCGCRKSEPADLIIIGKIYTGLEGLQTVEAVAVSKDRIVFSGSEKEARGFAGKNTRIVELGARVMTAGFIEGHAHLLGIGEQEMNLNLSDVRNYDDLVSRVRDAVNRAKPGEWIIGRGWHQDKWDSKPDKVVKGFQTHHQLSAVSPNNPVFLSHASGHAAMANAKAMEIAGVGILSAERLPSGGPIEEGGEVIMDELGNPTGIFVENAADLISKHIPDDDPLMARRAIELGLAACVRNGITGFHDAGVGGETIGIVRDLKKEKKLPLRLYLMLDGSDDELISEWFQRGPDVDPEHWLTIRAIKLYSDGALGSRGAWLLAPYEDRHETSGMPVMSIDTIAAAAKDALRHGFQLCTHAIGDRANREILDAYEQAFAAFPDKARDHRFRIEHAQHVDPADIPRFGKLGVIPAMQAIHMSSDRPWAIDRLGQKRIDEGAYMWQSLLKSGARIVNGTDAPVEPVNPLACFYASISRKTLQGEPEGGYEPKEKMTREQALRSYTLDAAFGAFQEEVKGTIEKGKLADFTVFSSDIMSIPEDEILTATVDMTIVGGQIVYERK